MLDRYLSYISRKVAGLRGVGRLIEPLRRYYVRRYQHGSDPWTVIEDFDGRSKFKLDRSTYLGSNIYWQGYASRHIIELLDRLLKPEMVLADVGGNQGEVTVCAARRLTAGKVLVFELQESSYRHLLENVQSNRFENVVAHGFGLSDKPGDVELFTSEDRVLHHSFHEGLTTMFRTDYRSSRIGSARVEVLDEVFEKAGYDRLDVMKLDVEGAELSILRGGRRTLERFRPRIILESNEESFKAAGYTPADVADFLGGLGYRFSEVGRRGSLTRLAGNNLPRLGDVLCEPCTS